MSEIMTEQTKELKIKPYLLASKIYSAMLNKEEPQRFQSAKKSSFKHNDTWVEFDQLGMPAPYRKTYDFKGHFINDNHRFYFECPLGFSNIDVCIDIGIDGYLQRGDALKIYELAYFSQGDILELGTHKGLSTSIIARAMQDSGSKALFETVDIDEAANAIARENLKKCHYDNPIKFNLMDAALYMDKLIQDSRKFSFIFIDHWHGYEATFEAAIRAMELIEDQGFIFFHDYNDQSNFDPEHVYGVYQAVCDTILLNPEFDFYGIFGCCALFRKRG